MEALIRTFYIKRIKRGISPCLIPRGYSKYVAFGHIMLRPETEARHHMMGVYSHWEILKLDGHLNIFIFRTFRTCFHQCDLGSWFFSLKSIESSFEKIAAGSRLEGGAWNLAHEDAIDWTHLHEDLKDLSDTGAMFHGETYEAWVWGETDFKANWYVLLCFIYPGCVCVFFPCDDLLFIFTTNTHVNK